MNTYTSDELVRIELLGYEQTEGLHPVERNWRNLAKKLLEDIKELEKALDKHHAQERISDNGNCFKCTLPSIVKRNFPEPFKPTSV